MLAKYTFLFSLLCCSCMLPLVVGPSGGEGSSQKVGAVETVQGIRLLPLAIPWRGGEHDLTEYVIPVAVEVRNDGLLTVDVQLEDFVLADEAGHAVQACAVPEPPSEATAPPPLRGPVLATLARPTSGDPDLELKFIGITAPPPVSQESQLALASGQLRSGQATRGFLFFQRSSLGDLQGLPALRLHYRIRGIKGSQVALGELEVRLKVQRQTTR